MENKIESKYVINIDEVLKNLKLVDDTLGGVEDTINRTGKNQSFDVLSQKVQNYNRTLADGSNIYRTIEGGVKSYRAEVDRLRIAEIALIKAQAEFKSSSQYDEAEKNLVAVRKRIQELNAELEQSAPKTEKAKGVFSSLGGIAKTVGLAIATYFTIDKLTDIEGQIIENTKAYEKYYAVLKNGFQDENKATESLAMIYQFASETPFAVNELTESFIKLNNRGFTPTKAEMTKLGDIAASQGKSFNQLTEGLLDAMTGEFERLKEFGITAKTVGDNVTLSFKGQEVTVNKFNQGALKEAVLGFGELKGVTGSMASVSRTLEGEISNLGDSWSQLLTSLGKSQGFLSGIIGLGKGVIDTLKDWVDVPIEKKLMQENTELNALGGALILANKNEAVRGQLLAEISQKYPSFLALLGKEADNTYAIESALKLVNEQYKIKIKLAGLDVLSKRDAEKQADIIEKEANAYDKAGSALKKYGYKLSEFQSMSTQEQARVIQRIKDQTKDTGTTSGFGGIRLETGLKDKAVAPFNELLKLTKQQDELENSSFQRELKKAVLTKNISDIRTNQIEQMKKENQELSKGLISQKEYQNLIKKGTSINGEEQAQKANFEKVKANKEQIVTFAKQGVEPPKIVPKTPTGGGSDKQSLKDTQDELNRLKDSESKFLDTINKMRLESENVRLSLLDKNSKEYIEKKKIYDLDIIEQEKQSFKDIYQVQVANQILKEQLEKKGSKVTEEELKRLKDLSEKQAIEVVNGNGSESFLNSKNTITQREILKQKALVIEHDYRERITKLEDDTNKEQLKRLAEQTALLGDGLDKQIITITNKYNQLIETYEKDANLVKELELKKAEEIAKATFESKDKATGTDNTAEKEKINTRLKASGQSDIQFEKQQKRDLLQQDVLFYSAKYQLLLDYLESEQYAKAVAGGRISEEEDKANKTRLNGLKDTLFKSSEILSNFNKTSKEFAVGTGNIWNDLQGVFQNITSETLKLSEDPALNKIINEQLATLVGSTQQAMSNILQMNIQGADDRISVLDDEISQKQTKVDSEYEDFKLGLANNFIEEKKALDAKKKEREAEVENKKKLQEKAALIDSLSVISANAVTVASTISAVAKTFEAHSAFPFIGIISALAGVATIVATLSSIGAKAKASTRLRFGGGINGNLHEAGGVEVGNTGIEVEGGEFVTRREQYAKKPTLFEALNDNTFGLKSMRQQHEMLKPFGLKLAKDREQILKVDISNKEKRDNLNVENSILFKHFGNIADGLQQVAENTSKISDYDYVQSGDETLKFNKKGKIIEIIKKSNG